MSIGMIRLLVILLWMFWLGVYWRGGSTIVADIIKAIKNPYTRIDAFLLIIMTFNSFIMLITGLIISLGIIIVNFDVKIPIIAGSMLVLIGIAGTLYSRYFLGKVWMAQTKIEENHTVVKQGPYAVVRHPIYTASIIMYTGLAMVFPAWWYIFSVIIVDLCYIFKTHDEDKYLRKHLNGYQDYSKAVKYRLLPFIW